MGNGRRPVKVFVSYSHKDTDWFDGIKRVLDVVALGQAIEYWSDKQIMPSEAWNDEILNKLEDADVVVAILSLNFMASAYCRQEELTRAMTREAAGQTRVVGILAEPCPYEELQLRHREMLPKTEEQSLTEISAYKEGHERNAVYTTIARRLTSLIKSLQETGPPSTAPSAQLTVDPPTRCLGRDEQQARIIAELTTNDAARVVLFGAAGIGKTTITRAVANHPDVRQRFGDCVFVSLQPATTAGAMLDAVASAFGMTPGGDALAAVQSRLQERSALIVLDNLETPLDGEDDALRLLQRLCQLHHAGMLASIRRNAPPPQVAWTLKEDVDRLDPPSARQLFCAIADQLPADDPSIDALLSELDGLPLAIELVAEQAADAGSAELTLKRWQQAPAKLLEIGDKKERSLKVSLDLSIDSPRLSNSARRLFALMGLFPDGVPRWLADELLAEPAHDAEHELRATRLIFEDARRNRLRMLAPVRETARDRTRDPADEDRSERLMWALVEAIRPAGDQPPDPTHYRQGRDELANLKAFVQRSIARETNPTQRTAYAWGRLGDGQTDLGNLASAADCYALFRTICERALVADPGNAGWQRDLSVSLNKIGDVKSAQGDLSGALDAFQQSLGIAGRLAEADPGNAGWQRDLSVSLEKIGDVKRAQGDLSGALDAFQQSLTIRQRLAEADPGNAGWQRDLVVSHWKLADLAERTDRSLAIEHWRTALQVAKDLRGSGRLAPRDADFVETIEGRLAALTND